MTAIQQVLPHTSIVLKELTFPHSCRNFPSPWPHEPENDLLPSQTATLWETVPYIPSIPSYSIPSVPSINTSQTKTSTLCYYLLCNHDSQRFIDFLHEKSNTVFQEEDCDYMVECILFLTTYILLNTQLYCVSWHQPLLFKPTKKKWKYLNSWYHLLGFHPYCESIIKVRFINVLAKIQVTLHIKVCFSSFFPVLFL